MEQQNQYVLYGYLTFLWKKKWLILLATIIGMGLGYGYTLTQPTTYTSTVNVFTGTAKNDDLSKPTSIVDAFKKQLTEGVSLQASIVDNYLIRLSVTGSNKDDVETSLTKVAASYLEYLEGLYKSEIKVIDDYSKSLNSSIKKTEELMELYNTKKLELSEDSFSLSFDETLLFMEFQIENKQAKIFQLNKEKNDLDEPELKDPIHNEEKPSSLRYIVLGGAAFFQLMLIIVILWKYIINARQFKEMSE